MSEGWRFVLLGYRSAFAEPKSLLLCLVALALAAVSVRAVLQSRRALSTLVGEKLIPKLAPGVSVARPIARGLLGTTGLCLFALALAQPQCGTRTQKIKRRGVDVVVALDASKSMLARDVRPSRLERAKLELIGLLDQLKGDRVAIVVFAGDAFIQCPLTSDYAAARLFLRAIDPAQMQQGGTNVGAALRLARQVLAGAERGAGKQVVVLLSDGEDLGGEVDAAADGLRDAGVSVLAVGIGSEGGEPIPLADAEGNVVDYQKDPAGNTVVSRLNRAGLLAIAQATGGELFYREQGVAISDVAARIDGMQKSELESRLAVEYDERFEWFAWPGFLFWVAGALLRPSSRRKEARA